MHRIKSIVQDNLILPEKHFHANRHDFNRDAKFTTLERIEIEINMK